MKLKVDGVQSRKRALAAGGAAREKKEEKTVALGRRGLSAGGATKRGARPCRTRTRRTGSTVVLSGLPSKRGS